MKRFLCLFLSLLILVPVMCVAFSTANAVADTNEVTLTLDAKGGTVYPKSISGKAGEGVTLPTPVRSEKISFDLRGGKGPESQEIYYGTMGWSLDKSMWSEDYKCYGPFRFGESDVTLYALWDLAAQGYITEEVPVKEGFCFVGWSTSPDSNRPSYLPGGSITTSQPKTLYAVWADSDFSDPVPQPGIGEINGYKLTLNPKGGTVYPKSISGETGKRILLPTPVRSEKLTFELNGGKGITSQEIYYGTMGWSLDESMWFEDYECYGLFEFGESDVTLYALWDLAAQGYITEEIPVKEGFEFLGWSYSKDALTATHAPGERITLSQGKTLYAVWKEIPVETPVITIEKNNYFASVMDKDGDPTPAFSINLSEVTENAVVSWSTDGSNAIKIVRSDAEGCIVQALSVGSATVTAIADVNGKIATDTCVVVVERYPNTETGVYISVDSVELEHDGISGPAGGEKSDEIIIRSIPADADIKIHVEDTSIAGVGFSQSPGEDFCRAVVYARSPGETKLIAEAEYNGVTYTAECIIKVLLPLNYGVVISENYIELDGSLTGSDFDGEESEEIIIRSVPVDCDINIYVENPSVANVGYIKKVGESFYRASVTGVNAGETNLVAETVICGVTFTDTCRIKVNAPDPEPGPGYEEPVDPNPEPDPEPGPGYEEPVDPNPETKVPVSCKIVTLPAKTSYTYKLDTKADLTGMVIEVTYSDGSKENISDTSLFNVKDFDTSSKGTKAVTVEYQELTVQYNITVSFVWWQWIIWILLLGVIWY